MKTGPRFLSLDKRSLCGYYGLSFRVNFKEVFGVVVRINGNLSQELQLIVRDNLLDAANEVEIEVVVKGHVVD